MPPRRIWLELRKLAAAEQAQGGSWAKSLALAHHLGLLPHLFPWLRGAGAAGAAGAVAAAARLASLGTAAGEEAVNGGADGGGIGGVGEEGSVPSAIWGRGSGGAPLEVLVAALVHPSSPPEVYQQVRVRRGPCGGWGGGHLIAALLSV